MQIPPYTVALHLDRIHLPHFSPSFIIREILEPWVWSSSLGQSWRVSQGRWIIAIVLSCWVQVLSICQDLRCCLSAIKGFKSLLALVLKASVLWALTYPSTSTFITHPWSCCLPPHTLQQHVRGQLSFTLTGNTTAIHTKALQACKYIHIHKHL